jgi:hypothetical protein
MVLYIYRLYDTAHRVKAAARLHASIPDVVRLREAVIVSRLAGLSTCPHISIRQHKHHICVNMWQLWTGACCVGVWTGA